MNFATLTQELGTTLKREQALKKRYERTGSYKQKTPKKDSLEYLMAQFLDQSVEGEGKDLVHIMPKEINLLKQAGFDVDTSGPVVDVAEPLASAGRNGDTEVAAIDGWGAEALKSLGGSGSVNPVTGLREYWNGEGDDSSDGVGYGGGNTDGGHDDGGEDHDGLAGMGLSVTQDEMEEAFGEIDDLGAAVSATIAEMNKQKDMQSKYGYSTNNIVGMMERAKDFGLSIHDVVDRNRDGSTPDFAGMMDEVEDYSNARLSHDPSLRERMMNKQTELGFITENPAISAITGIVGTVLGSAIPGASVVTGLANLDAHLDGRPGLMGVAGLATGHYNAGDFPGLVADSTKSIEDLMEENQIDFDKSLVGEAINSIFGQQDLASIDVGTTQQNGITQNDIGNAEISEAMIASVNGQGVTTVANSDEEDETGGDLVKTLMSLINGSGSNQNWSFI